MRGPPNQMTSPMRTHLLSLAVPLVLAAPSAAQDPYVRPKTQIDTTTVGIGLQPSISNSDSGTTAVVYLDGGSGGTQNVYAVIGTGDGTTWSAPDRADDDTTGANKLTQFDSCFVSGDVVYALWKDERDGSTNDDLYFARRPAGGPFDPDVQIDIGPATGTGGKVNAWRLAVSPDPLGDHVYVLASIDTPSDANDRLYLCASHDGGQTFGTAVHVPQSAGTYSVESTAIAAQGTTVHVAWADDRLDAAPGAAAAEDDVWYQRSTDGGATFLPADVQLDSSGPLGDAAASAVAGFRIAARGNLVVAAWLEELNDPIDEEVRLAVSTDGGTTWGADSVVGGYDVAAGHDVDSVDVHIAENGNVCVAYNDNRTGSDDRVYVSTSTDAGATWNETDVSGVGGGNAPFFSGSGSYVGLCFAGDAGPSNAAYAADSSDSGVTWRTGVELQDQATDADSASAGWNGLYKNWTHAWLANDFSTNNVFVGGYRAQSVIPAVSAPDVNGNVSVGFGLAGFATDPVGFVLLAAAPGSFPLAALNDPRDLGLANDALLQYSLTTLFWVAALPGGSGTTPTLVTNQIGSGFAFYAAAASLRVVGSSIVIGELSDVVPVTVP